MATLLTSLAATSAAGDIPLALPIDCTLGDTCHIQQTVDHDPTSGASDFSCGLLTYDGHKGTDFALPSLAAQAAGVNVVAAAPGTVHGVRDGMADILQISPNAPDVTEKECGNGVVVSHGNGWETQYCHLANGSVAVETGDTVAIGTVLGQVGLSGQTQFPHLHLSVRHNGNVVDPFDPDGAITCDAPSDNTLWSDAIDVPAGGIITAGFAPAIPEYADVKAGTANAGTLRRSDNLVVWGYIFGGQIGDEITLTINGPDGEVIDQTVLLDRNQSQLFRATGRKAPRTGWPSGAYTGSIAFIRGDDILDTATAAVSLH
ncbi:hypothetical protein FHS72_002780 [Loktanella ponticola]|uniref:M23ase beta-sheet core domain-containing protein n=1 Tax=Yoonia ponticola TaxID=1524255 RepID=A0A7W9EYT0_9RHOB|nr:M23 family metallopeptidase [Yoonia ponticola]MBB5723143.1 hypothetical protein [Yoonia ponticola]